MATEYSKKDVARVMQQVFRELIILREAGQKEYAHLDDRPFRNFEESAESFGMTRITSLLHYAKKHWDGILAFAKGHKSQREDVRGRINDMIVYLILLRAMIDEDDGMEPSELSALNPQDLIRWQDLGFISVIESSGPNVKVCLWDSNQNAEIQITIPRFYAPRD